MASSGNASDYGDLTVARDDTGEESNCCSSTRAIIAGGSDGSSPRLDKYQQVTIEAEFDTSALTIVPSRIPLLVTVVKGAIYLFQEVVDLSAISLAL